MSIHSIYLTFLQEQNMHFNMLHLDGDKIYISWIGHVQQVFYKMFLNFKPKDEFYR